MQFDTEWFNDHLDDMGQDLLWRRSYACPCKNPHSGASRPNCPQCSGRGIFWTDPVEVSAAPSGQKTQLQWAQFGLFQAGDVVITIPEDSPMYAMGQFDRVTKLNSTDQFSIALTRGSDTLNFMIENIERVFWLDQSGTIIEGDIPTVTNAGVPSWESGAPPAGSQYTISGTRFSEYFCWGPYPSDRNMHHGARLPRKVVLRTFDLFGR